MNRQIIKKLILCLMTVILCVTTCAPAFASKGDRTVMRFTPEEQADQSFIRDVFPIGDGFCIYYMQGEMNQKQVILRYADPNAEPEEFILQNNNMSFGEDEDVPADGDEATVTDLPAAGETIADEGSAVNDAAAEGENLPAAGEIVVNEESAVNDAAAEGENLPAAGETVVNEESAANDVTAEGENLPAGEDFIADEGLTGYEGLMEGEEYYIEQDYTYEFIDCIFTWKDDLYALVQRNEYKGMETKQSIIIKHIKLEDGKAVTEDCDVPEPDTSSLMQDYEGGSYFSGISNPMVIGDTLVGTTYGNNGSELVAFDLTTGYCTEFVVEEFNGIAAGPDGTVLMNRYEWDDDALTSKATVVRLNLDDQSEETVLELTGDNVYSLNLCYDQDNDVLYYTLNGELWAAPHMDKEQAFSVNECPEAGNGAICLKDGFLLIWTNNAVLLRNTDPAQRSSITIRADISGWNTAATDAVYAMNETRGDVAVLLQSDYTRDFDMMQAMMNRDSYMDIYMIYCSGANYTALQNRGFIKELNSSEQISTDTARMYPYIREALMKDGKIYGVPLYVSGSMLGVNFRLWKKMGGTEEELPKTWDQFFDWLETLPEKLTEDIKLVEDYQWMDRDAFRSNVRSLIMTQYQIMMDNKGEEDFVFNTPLVNGLLKRLDEVDYDALGVKEADESQQELGGVYYGDDNDPLLQFYYSGTPGDYYSNMYMPLALSLEEGEDPIIPADVEVAILNPFSEHPEEALLYLSLLLKNMGQQDQYTLYTDKTEPSPYAYYEDNMKSYEESLKFLRENLEKAEGDEKTLWETYIRETEESMEEMDRWGWKISKNAVENYLKVVPLMKVPSHNYMEDILGAMDDEAQEAFYKELDRENDVDKYLNTIDNKLQMVRKEGH